MIRALLLLLLLLSNLAFAEVRSVFPAEVFQGRSFIIFIASPEAKNDYRAQFDGKSIRFFPYEEGVRAIIGTLPEQKLGDYDLVINKIAPRGQTETQTVNITVSHCLYPKVSFWLKPAKKKLLTPDLIAREWALIEAKILEETPYKLWRGLFLKPVPGITTMAFGTREYINGRISGRHRGQDFRAKPSTPIKATNDGKVVVAEFFKSFGGTVVIDHGQGVHSLYFHQSKILAREGKAVGKGEVIGLSGNTGISSGPHLHWGMSVHNVRVDPMQWVQTVML
jgi:hypothetical protein